MKQRSEKRIGGFSLIEVVVGIAVLGLVTVPVCASLVLSVRINSHSRDLMNAQLEAAGMVETLMSEGIDPAKYDAQGEWIRDGVQIKIAEQQGGAYYDVTVIGEENGRTVQIETSVRSAAEGGDS